MELIDANSLYSIINKFLLSSSQASQPAFVDGCTSARPHHRYTFSITRQVPVTFSVRFEAMVCSNPLPIFHQRAFREQQQQQRIKFHCGDI
jgi:hypothetical protein